MLQLLAPGVKDAEKADLGAEVLRVPRHFEKCLGTGSKQQMVDELLVLQHQDGQIPWQGEDDMRPSAPAAVPDGELRASAYGHWPGTSGSAGSGTSCRRMARRSQSRQRSRCPPSAAVRQRSIARSTFTCDQIRQLLTSAQGTFAPPARTMSASSNAGRLLLSRATRNSSRRDPHHTSLSAVCRTSSTRSVRRRAASFYAATLPGCRSKSSEKPVLDLTIF